MFQQVEHEKKWKLDFTARYVDNTTPYSEIAREISRRLAESIATLGDENNEYTLDKGIPIAKLDDRAQSGIGISLLFGILNHRVSLDRNTPYIAGFSDVILKGEMVERANEKSLYIELGLPNTTTGKLDTYSSIGVILPGS